MLTGQGSEAVMLDALRLGAQDYIIKENISAETLSIALVKARELFDAKRARRQAEEQLQHTRKMEAVGQLTSGVAHDFNDLFTVVIGNIHLLRRRLAYIKDIPDDVEKEDTRHQKSSAGKGSELVRRLMVFTRQSTLAQEVVDINHCIAETVELLKSTLGENIGIKTIWKDDTWPVLVDASEFENILLNFALNARDAMPRGGKLTIEVDNVTLDEAYALHHPGITAGDYVMVAINTGTGMPPDVRQRVFEPFFTTKPPGEGTGLGVGLAYGFVQQCGGHIHVYSEEGHGTVFRIYLPKLAVETDTARSHHQQRKLHRGEQRLSL